MANIKDCPGFETFGADVKEARKVKQLSRKTLAEQVNIDWRYLANIENDGTIPSLPVIIQLIKICGLPVERYFNPEIMREESAQRQRVSHKLKLCPEEFLPVIEGANDGAIHIQQKYDETVGAGQPSVLFLGGRNLRPRFFCAVFGKTGILRVFPWGQNAF